MLELFDGLTALAGGEGDLMAMIQARQVGLVQKINSTLAFESTVLSKL